MLFPRQVLLALLLTVLPSLLFANELPKASLPVSRVHQRWMLNKMNEALKNDLDANLLGLLDRAIYQRVVNQLQQQGWLQKPIDYDAFFFTTSAIEPGD
nr:hypothetical protein [uncultured Desulfuromonas sp.]